MSDLMLIGALRAPHDPDDHLDMVQLIDRAKQAADEIERLRGDLQEARLQRDAKLSSETAVNEAAQREIERLRAALERILELDPDFGEPYVAAVKAQATAREALDE